MKKILIIQGHPDNQSYCHALADAYQAGALESGAEIRHIKTSELVFDLNLAFGYRQRIELEPCLLQAQEDIRWANHIVMVYPVWWGMVPAVLKGFIDRVFLPGFAFRKRPGSLWWDKLLKGRTARIVSTMDQPAWYYRLVYKMPSNQALKKLTLEFCGIRPVKVTNIGPLKNSKEGWRKQWLGRMEAIGKKEGSSNTFSVKKLLAKTGAG